jgi:hypothetical protein
MAAPSISDRIKAGRGKTPEFRDVDVILDGHVSAQITKLEDEIEVYDQKVAALEEEKQRLHPQLPTRPVREKELDEEIAGLQERSSTLEEQRDELRKGTVVTLRFDKMPGEQWAALAARHPARIDVTIDRLSGYDYQATARDAAPLCGYALGEDESREDLSKEDWDGLWPILSGREAENIATSLWELNDWSPRRKIEAAKKG